MNAVINIVRAISVGSSRLSQQAGGNSRFICLAIIIVLLLAACGSPSAPPDAEAEPAASTATATAPSPTGEPTATASPTATPSPEPSPTPLVEPREGREFTYYGEDPAQPVVAAGPDDRWDGLFINPGGMLVHDGLFHMFRNGFSDWPGLVSVGYMTSTDGLSWTEVQAEPVFTSDQVPYVSDGDGADVSSVLVMDDGTWVMYFHLVSRSQPAVIGRATAPSPIGPWTADPQPVLLPGPDGAWDDAGVSWPSVLQTPEGYHMCYAGSPGAIGDTMIGLATSADGVTWQKHDGPATAEAPFAESDPVLQPDELWTSGGVDRARVVLAPEGWLMIYQGGPLVKRGLASSQDGLQWTVHPDNPVITLEDFPISGTMWDTALVHDQNTYFYYTEIGSMAGTDIYLAIHQGPFTIN